MGMSRRSGDAYCESRCQIPTKHKLLLVVQQITRPPRHFRDNIVGQRDAGAIVSGRAEGALATDAPKNHRSRAPIESFRRGVEKPIQLGHGRPRSGSRRRTEGPLPQGDEVGWIATPDQRTEAVAGVLSAEG